MHDVSSLQVTINSVRVSLNGNVPRYMVSRPTRQSWFNEEPNSTYEILLFSENGIHPFVVYGTFDYDVKGVDREPIQLPFNNDPLEPSGSASWDPWLDRVLFCCGGREIYSVGYRDNHVDIVAELAHGYQEAPATCDCIAVDPNQQGILWVVTAVDPDGGGAVYVLDLRSSSAGPTQADHVQRINQAPLKLTKLADFPEPLRAASFDVTRRCLLVASRTEIYSVSVDNPHSEPQLLISSGSGALRLQEDDPQSLPLVDVTGLTCDGDGNCFVTDQVPLQSARRRGTIIRSCVRRLVLPRGAASLGRGISAAATIADKDGPATDRRLNASTAGSSEAAAPDGPVLVTIATADNARWRSPCVLPDGILALITDSEHVTLLPLGLRPPGCGTSRGRSVGATTTSVHKAKAGRAMRAAAPTGTAVGPQLGRSLAADLGELLEGCQPPNSRGSADVVLVAAGGREVLAHGCILAARCEYFKPLLGGEGGFSDSGARRLELLEADAAALLCALRHVYTGSVDHLDCLGPVGGPSAESSACASASAFSGDVQCPAANPPGGQPTHGRPPAQKAAGVEGSAGPATVGENEEAPAPRGADGPNLSAEVTRPGRPVDSPLQGDLLLGVAEVADRLLLPELCRAAQGRVLRRARERPAAHLVADMVWAERRGFGRLLEELKELYLQHAEELGRVERQREHKRRGHSGRSVGDEGGGSGGVCCGPKCLAAASPVLAAELEEVLTSRKRLRGS